MNFMKKFLMLILVLGISVSCMEGFAETHPAWHKTLDESEPTKVFVAPVKNSSNDTSVDVRKVTNIIKEVISGSDKRKFIIVDTADEADYLFESVVSDYVWSKKAPLTNVFPPAALALDEATRGKKDWARMELDYKIYKADGNRLVLDYETQVTLKQANMSRDKSYSEIYDRLPGILSRDLFKKADKM